MGLAITFRPSDVRIPPWVVDLETFRKWTRSAEFPEDGRIDWIGGELEVDVSPEEGNTHGTLKSAIVADLIALVDRTDLGAVYTDSMRFTSPMADLSVEPDVTVVLFDSLRAGKVKLIPRASDDDEYIEIEGPADVVVECVSDSSVTKDRKKLFAAYYAAGVREYWIVDARGEKPTLEIHGLGKKGYVLRRARPGGWISSTVLGRSFRLLRRHPIQGVVRYRLESK